MRRIIVENISFIEALKKLKKIKALNYGGCGIATLAILRWIKNNCPDELQNISIISLFYSRGRNLSEIKSKNRAIYLSKNKRDSGTVPNHIGILYKNKLFFDSNNHGVFLPSYLKIEGAVRNQIQIFTKPDKAEEFLLYLINKEPGDWNPFFNRKKQVQRIEKKLKISLSDVDTR